MDCVNHSGVSATAYCQNCGKALCSACVRSAPGGQIFCEPCWTVWQGMQQPFVPPSAGVPSPGLAAFLGLIPGVGAMYNGQFIKGLVHVVIFAVLVSAVHVYWIFGLFIAGWVFYQVFEAYHTAKARRDGEPLPDPLGLNDIGSWFAAGGRPQGGAGFGATGAGTGGGYYRTPAQAGNPMPDQMGGQASDQDTSQGSNQGANQAASEAPYQSVYQGPYGQGPYGRGTYAPPPPGFTGPGGMPTPPYAPVPPVPPVHWRRREPIGAVILIALGVLFLVGQMNWFSGRMFEFSWPVLLIGLGVWLVVRRLQESGGNAQGNSQGGPK
jgi:TM2 domain-containing membrane protein YozV